MLLRRRPADRRDRAVAVDHLPAVNRHVDVRTVSSDDPRPTRVEDARPGAVVISRPTDAAGHPLRASPGEELVLRWTSESGLHEVTGVLQEVVDDPVPCWVVGARSLGPVVQRREGFRLPVRLPLTLRARSDGAATVEGTVCDLSEGGLGLRVPARAPLESGMAVEVVFMLDDGDVTAAAVLVRLGPPVDGERAGGARFDEPGDELATRIRRYVLQEQIRRRALVRD